MLQQGNVAKQRWLIILQLLLSGNVQPVCLSGLNIVVLFLLNIVHLNVYSLLSTISRILVKSADADIVVIYWLTKSVIDKTIDMDGYNVC